MSTRTQPSNPSLRVKDRDGDLLDFADRSYHEDGGVIAVALRRDGQQRAAVIVDLMDTIALRDYLNTVIERQQGGTK